MKKKYYLSLDLGTYKTILVVSTLSNDGRIEIIDFLIEKSKGMSKGVVEYGERVKETINILFSKFYERNKELNNNYEYSGYILIGIAGSHTKISNVKIDYEVDKNKQECIDHKIYKEILDEVANHKVNSNQSIINIIESNYLLNKNQKTINPISMSASSIEGRFLIVKGQKASLNNIKNCLSNHKVKKHEFLLEPLASSFVALKKSDKEKGVMLIDIGGGTTDIAIFKDNTIVFSEILPIAGNAVTNDIANKFVVTKEVAQTLKHNYGDAFPNPNKADEKIKLSDIVFGYKEEKEISYLGLSKVVFYRYYEILFYCYSCIKKSNYEKSDIDTIVITGGGSLQKNLINMIDYFFEIPVKSSSIYNSSFSNLDNEKMTPEYSTVLGLVAENHFQNYLKVENVKKEGAETTSLKDETPRKISNIKRYLKRITQFNLKSIEINNEKLFD